MLLPFVVAAGNSTGALVNTIDTSTLTPVSPDPSGLAYDPLADRLLLVDGEVEETSVNAYPYEGANGWAFDRMGATTATFDTTDDRCVINGTTRRNTEPVGLARDPASGNLFVSHDSGNVIWELDAATLSTVRCFSAAIHGVTDAEGLAFGDGNLFIADGTASDIWQVSPGANGIFGDADDAVVSRFDTAALGQADPEGLDFDPVSRTLYMISNRAGSPILEVTPTGSPVRTISTSGVPLEHPRGLALAPGTNESAQHVYVADSRVDNNDAPSLIDGRIYELSVADPVPPPPPPPPAEGELLLNPSFEIDENANNIADNWGTNTKFTRSTETPPAHGSFVGRHFATNDAGYTVSQQVAVSGGNWYAYRGLVQVPATSDAFTFTIRLRWLNASGSTITTLTAATFTAPTAGWQEVTANLQSPANATAAQVQMVVSSLKATIYVDDFSLVPGQPPPPPPPPTGNLLANPGFELDADANAIPDRWGSQSAFTRSDATTPHEGAYVGRHFATDNSGYTISQDVAVIGGTRYLFDSWVSIPATGDKFTFTLKLQWRNAGGTLSTVTVRQFKTATADWQLAAADVVAPAEASTARVIMTVSNLNATIYVDDFSFVPDYGT
jgi:hypothetical protein